MKSQKAIETEPDPPLNNTDIVDGDSSGALASYSTRLVDVISDDDEDNIIARNSGSGLEPKEKVYWPKSFGVTQENSLIKSFDHTQANDSEETEIPPETAQGERASPKPVSGFDFQRGKRLLRENAEASLSPPPPKLPVVDDLPPLEAPVTHDRANAITWCSDDVEEDGEDDASDIMSVPSLYSGSSLFSARSIEELDVAAEELASLLLTDEIMEPFYNKALEKVEIERFERNFARLLNAFAVDLRAEAITVLELSAVQFVRIRAKHVACCMGKQLDPLREEAVQRMHNVILESPEREEKVEMYLQRRILTTDLAESPGPHEIDYQDIQEPNLKSGSEESETETAQQPRFKDLKEVKTFIFTSSAMTILRENFRQFVSQGQSKTQKLSPSAASHQGPLPELLAHNDLLLQEKDTDSIDTFEDDEGDLGGQEGDRRPRSLPRFVLSILRGFKTTAEFLELIGKPLQPGLRRLRWTCVSSTFLLIFSMSKRWCTKYQHIL